MKFLALAGALLLGHALAVQAEEADKKKPAGPAASQQQEERTGAHSQPNTAGTSATDAAKEDKTDKTRKADKTKPGGASAGSTNRGSDPAAGEKEKRFKALDIDGDGAVSKAEAAGHEEVVTGFDRADRNKDGKLSVAEYGRLGEKPARTASRQRRDNASAGPSAQPQQGSGGMRSANSR